MTVRPSTTWFALGASPISVEDENGDTKPVGQKMFLADGEDLPILEPRKIEFSRPQAEKLAVG